jgi:hypothetical protein
VVVINNLFICTRFCDRVYAKMMIDAFEVCVFHRKLALLDRFLFFIDVCTCHISVLCHHQTSHYFLM